MCAVSEEKQKKIEAKQLLLKLALEHELRSHRLLFRARLSCPDCAVSLSHLLSCSHPLPRGSLVIDVLSGFSTSDLNFFFFLFFAGFSRFALLLLLLFVLPLFFFVSLSSRSFSFEFFVCWKLKFLQLLLLLLLWATIKWWVFLPLPLFTTVFLCSLLAFMA